VRFRYAREQSSASIFSKSIDAKSGKKFDVFDPATGQAVAAVAEADKADVDDAVKAARRAFETAPWSRPLRKTAAS
jgi:phenylacetaldehyde dehydrogenase